MAVICCCRLWITTSLQSTRSIIFCFIEPFPEKWVFKPIKIHQIKQFTICSSTIDWISTTDCYSNDCCSILAYRNPFSVGYPITDIVFTLCTYLSVHGTVVNIALKLYILSAKRNICNVVFTASCDTEILSQ